MELSLTHPTSIGHSSVNGENYNNIQFSKGKYSYELRDMLDEFEGDIYHSYKLVVFKDKQKLFESQCEGVSQYFSDQFRNRFN